MADLLTFPAPAAPPAEPPASDAAARERALDPHASFIVEAPAGSGKTALLIQRFLKLLAGDDVQDPAEVLAITFTRKATHEMRDRVLEQLAAARRNHPLASPYEASTRTLAQAVLARDAALGWGLLEHPARLNISTIDALSIRIASSLPVLTGGSGLSPVDRAEDLFAAAARNTLAHLGGPDPALTRSLESLLLHRDGNLGDCERLLAGMLPWRDQWLDLLPSADANLTDATFEHQLETVTLPRMERLLEQAVCRALTRLERLMPPALCEELALLARQLSHAGGHLVAESPIALCRELHAAPGAAAEDLAIWRAFAHLTLTKGGTWRAPRGLTARNLRFDIAPADKQALADLIDSLSTSPGLSEALAGVENLPPLRYPPEQWLILKHLFRVLRQAVSELGEVFARTRTCDFTEFSLRARQALARTASPAGEDLQAAASGFAPRHLLVDEVQDTSNAQYELLRLLTAGWDGQQRTVFLVGDPKQSIYSFRQARVERFLDTLRAEHLGSLALTPLYLTRNFRSQANLVDGFNDTFAPIFPPETEAAVTYQPAEPTRPGTSGPALLWHANPLPHGATLEDQAQARKHHAELLRARIEAWRARPLPPGRSTPWTIAVLVSARSHLTAILAALQAGPHPIPFRAVNVQPLAERQEILDLVSLTRALLHPADRTAWFALLRTPWCGLTLRDLHLLAGADDSQWAERTVFEILSQRGELLSSDGIARLQPFWAVMDAALAQRGRLPLAQLVERTWRAFAADRFTSSQEFGNQEFGNIDRFFGLLDQLEAAEPVTAAILTRALDGLFAAPSTEPDAVEILTIHGAKGLEWDVVFVPALERKGQGGDQRLLSWLELDEAHAQDQATGPDAGEAHGLVAPLSQRGTDTHQLTRWMRGIQTAREEAERKRLFYVACTRAREELHLFAAPEISSSGAIRHQPGTLLHAAWPAAEAHIQPAAEAHVQPAAEASHLEDEPLDLAASAGPQLVPSPLETRPIDAAHPLVRIPLEAMPSATLARLHPPRRPAPTSPPAFHRSRRTEGIHEARAFGETLHDLLAFITQQIAGGLTPESLHQDLQRSPARIETLLRAHGLSQEAIPAAALRVQHALTRTLGDLAGRWLLTAHRSAASELPLANLRPDRVFLAGPEPAVSEPPSTAETHLWVVDYKSSTSGRDDVEQFLRNEREHHRPQLEAYAASLAGLGLPIRLALYFPVHARLIWWPHELAPTPEPTLF